VKAGTAPSGARRLRQNKRRRNKMKEYTVIISRRGKEREVTDTIPNLIQYFSYTLKVGQSWEHEKGNKKINTNPKSIKSLIDNLNKAESNRAKNGCSSTYYYEK
jgi:hypothetical protein